MKTLNAEVPTAAPAPKNTAETAAPPPPAEGPSDAEAAELLDDDSAAKAGAFELIEEAALLGDADQEFVYPVHTSRKVGRRTCSIPFEPLSNFPRQISLQFFFPFSLFLLSAFCFFYP